jgi:hypothetical protein
LGTVSPAVESEEADGIEDLDVGAGALDGAELLGAAGLPVEGLAAFGDGLGVELRAGAGWPAGRAAGVGAAAAAVSVIILSTILPIRSISFSWVGILVDWYIGDWGGRSAAPRPEDLGGGQVGGAAGGLAFEDLLDVAKTADVGPDGFGEGIVPGGGLGVAGDEALQLAVDEGGEGADFGLVELVDWEIGRVGRLGNW